MNAAARDLDRIYQRIGEFLVRPDMQLRRHASLQQALRGPQPGSAAVYVHGGGMILGTLDGYDAESSRVVTSVTSGCRRPHAAIIRSPFSRRVLQSPTGGRFTAPLPATNACSAAPSCGSRVRGAASTPPPPG
jgi:hypothetical protein